MRVEVAEIPAPIKLLIYCLLSSLNGLLGRLVFSSLAILGNLFCHAPPAF